MTAVDYEGHRPEDDTCPDCGRQSGRERVALMSDRSTIGWTDATWNPVTGCTKVSPGCDHCYAETLAERFRDVPGKLTKRHGRMGSYFSAPTRVAERVDRLQR